MFTASLVLSAAMPAAAQSAQAVEVVEYFHADLDHYFITADPGEIAALDANPASGWKRTDATFQAYPPGSDPSVSPVCRFYGLPSAGLNSHFYSASPAECAETQRRYAASWQLESNNVFGAAVPDPISGACPANTLPVYRLFNQRADANHRYTTDVFVRAQMIIAGYVPEGFGSDGVVFCSPRPNNDGPAKIVATRVLPDTYGFSGSAGSTNRVIMAYAWDFGDGQHATGPTALHKYNASGSYTVSLNLTDQSGAATTVTTRVDANVGGAPPPPARQVPTCTVTSNTPNPVAGVPVTLLANCTGSPTAYRWTNCSGSSNACVVQANAAGTQTYTVAGINSVGTGAPAQIQLTWLPPGTVPPPPSARPSCAISASAASAIIGAIVTLTATCTGAPTAYAWTNCTSTTATCQARATAAGTATYSVTATNAGGTSAPVSTQVVWATAPAAPGARPTCTLTPSAATATVGSSVTLNASCTGSPTSYAWTNCTSTNSTCVARASAAGTATYSVVASNAAGASTAAATQVSWTAAPVTPPPIVGAPGTWTRYNTSVQAGNEAYKQSWYNLAWDTRRNRAYGISWFKTLSAFDPAQGRWVTVRAGSMNDFHNRTIAYDPVNDRLWASNGTGNEGVAFQYYDFASDQWVAHCANSCNEPSYEAAMIYDAAGQRFIAFGGWVNTSVRTFSLQPVGTNWQNTSVTGGPNYNTDFKKMAAWRSVLDTPRNRILYVDSDGSLWALPLALTGWQRITTNGTPPPEGTQFVYDAANDAIVGWSASPRIAGGDTAPGTTRETWTLSMSTMTWARAASAAAGATVPPDTPYVGYAMVYDPVRQQTLLHTNVGGSESDPQTWIYRYGGGATPPPSPPPAGSPPSCSVAASTNTPVVGATLTLTATCSNSPTSYAWTGCNSTTASCSATSATTGSRTYSVTATNAAGTSPAASVTVNWQAAPVTPPPGTPGNYTGVITSFPLPAIYGAPFSTRTSSKHTNMASDGRRLYVSGGDWVTSATDGTWSMDLSNGSWRQDVPAPVYPTLPAPHALQDGAGFVWVASRNKFLLWPGSYYPYEGAGNPILNYARGMWWFDPATNSYTQETGLFGAMYSNTGNLFGGVYDEVNGHIVAFGDSSTAPVVKRWDVNALVQLPDLPYRLTNPGGYAAYYRQGQHVKIGRHVYILGFRTNGTRASQQPVFLRWHLDNQTMEELPAPPANGPQMELIEIRLATSRGKVVWPFMSGPEGDLHGIYVYNPANNTWYTDTQVPSYGNFIANSVTSLPDGRVAMSGGVFGRQQTHMWFYDAQ